MKVIRRTYMVKLSMAIGLAFDADDPMASASPDNAELREIIAENVMDTIERGMGNSPAELARTFDSVELVDETEGD